MRLSTHPAINIIFAACPQILRELRHENIVCLEEVYLDPETRDVWLLFLYAEHDLQVHMREFAFNILQ
jgi:hypothetical protein